MMPVVAIRVSKLKVRMAKLSIVPARSARRMPKPSVEKGERMYVISSRLGSDKLKVLPLAARFAGMWVGDMRFRRFHSEARKRKTILKMRVHSTGRNQPFMDAEAPMPKSIAPKASVATIAQRTPWLHKECPGCLESARNSTRLVEASTRPRMTRMTNPMWPKLRRSCKMRTESRSVKVELVAVIGLTIETGPTSNAR